MGFQQRMLGKYLCGRIAGSRDRNPIPSRRIPEGQPTIHASGLSAALSGGISHNRRVALQRRVRRVVEEHLRGVVDLPRVRRLRPNAAEAAAGRAPALRLLLVCRLGRRCAARSERETYAPRNPSSPAPGSLRGALRQLARSVAATLKWSATRLSAPRSGGQASSNEGIRTEDVGWMAGALRSCPPLPQNPPASSALPARALLNHAGAADVRVCRGALPHVWGALSHVSTLPASRAEPGRRPQRSPRIRVGAAFIPLVAFVAMEVMLVPQWARMGMVLSLKRRRRCPGRVPTAERHLLQQHHAPPALEDRVRRAEPGQAAADDDHLL
eukprot:gene9756-biopygen13638